MRTPLIMVACMMLGSAPLAAEVRGPSLPEAGQNPGDPVYKADPWIDLGQKWCGRPAKTRTERIERSRAIMTMYAQAYRDVHKTGQLKNDWYANKCWARGATYLGGTFAPDGAPVSRRRVGMIDENDGTVPQQEITAYLKVVPDWTTIPGTVWIQPWEDGAYYHINFGGHARDGKFYDVWEVGIIRLDRSGHITHWEYWNDTAHIDTLMRATFGQTLGDAQQRAGGYVDMIKKSAKD